MKRYFCEGLLSLVILTGATQLQAGSHTWSGAVNGNWSVAGNWSAGGAPTSGESPLHLIFPVAPVRVFATNDIAGLQVDTLTLNNWGYTLFGVAGKPLTLKGSGTNIVSNGSNEFDGSLALVLAGTNLISVTTNEALTINGPISGSGGLVKIGLGQLNFYGTATNSYSGSTVVQQGRLELQRGVSLNNAATAIAGPLIAGTRTGAVHTVYVNLNHSHQLASGVPVTVFKSAVVNLALGVQQTVGAVKMEAGTLGGTVGSLLTLTGDVTVTNYASINAPMSLGGTNRTFDVKQFSWLNLGEIRDGGNNAGWTKLGIGILTLERSNSYGGLTIIKGGLVELRNAFSLGSPGAGTIATNTGQLRFSDNFTVTGESLTLSGFGEYNTGTIYADSYTNVWTGPVTLVGDTRIEVLNPEGKVTFLGPISGTGGLDKIGQGTVIFAGSTANLYSGVTSVSEGKVQLSKTNAVALSGPLLIGTDEVLTNNAAVQLLRTNQFAPTIPVSIGTSGLLDMSGINLVSSSIGSLAGSGEVRLGMSTLTVGANNSNSVFSGLIAGFGFANFVKTGNGSLSLNGNSPAFVGSTIVNGGTLSLNGAQEFSPVTVNPGAALTGNGMAGLVTVIGGMTSPGNSTGLLQSGNLTLNSNSTFSVEINGPVAGSSYDQLKVNGTVNLGNAVLAESLGFGSAQNSQFVIINNDAADIVNGTFKNLGEGGTLAIGGAQFQISYHGGDGNDVVLTQISAGAPQFGGVTRLGTGDIQLNGSGVAGLTYTVQANTNLATTNWVVIGSALAGGQGQLSFIDTNAFKFSQRFYRFKAP